MRQLQDAWTIRQEFTRHSRWHMLASALYGSKLYYRADIYLGLILALLVLVAGYIEHDIIIMAAALLPVHFFKIALTPALRDMHPISEAEIELEDKYRRDFQYFRFKLFSQSLTMRSITPQRVKQLTGLIQLESELREANTPVMGRPAFAIQLTLFIGLLAALGSIDRFWVQGYVPTLLAMLPMTMYATYFLLTAWLPRKYQEKELALFLEWYCLSEP